MYSKLLSTIRLLGVELSQGVIYDGAIFLLIASLQLMVRFGSRMENLCDSANPYSGPTHYGPLKIK